MSIKEYEFSSNKDLFAPVVFRDVFNNSECQQIINDSKGSEISNAEIGERTIDNSIRETKVKFLDLNDNNIWIGKRIIPIIETTNTMRFKFKITRLKELHLLEYTENCFYDWHLDLNTRTEGTMRKLSIIIFLSDEKDYEGGNIIFEMNERPNIEYKRMSKGSMLIFPSFLPHRVSHVTKGIRHTLVAWIHGPAFQ